MSATATATAGVILSIGSKFGPGGLASLQAGIQMIGQLARSIKGVFDEAWKYDVMVKQLEVDTTMADQATKGLIDTTELVRGAMKFQAAQMKITDKQLRDIAVAAENMADKLGTDATEEFNKLTDAITKGQTRALKQYGLDLENTEDLLKAQAEALQKVTALGSTMATEYDNLGDRLYSLDNALGTLRNTVLGSLESWDWFNARLDDAIEGANKLTESIGDIGVSNTLGNAIDVVRVGITGMTMDFLAATGAVSDLQVAMTKLQQLQKLQEKATDRTFSGASWSDVVGGLGGAEQTPDIIGLQSDIVDRPSAAKKKKGGGGGRKAVDVTKLTPEARLEMFAKEAESERQLATIEQERVAIKEAMSLIDAEIFGMSEEAKLSEVEQWEFERRAQQEEQAYQERKQEYLAQYDEAETVRWERERQQELERAAYEERKLVYLDQYREKYNTTMEDFLFGEADYKAQSEAMWKDGLSNKIKMSTMFLTGWAGLMDKSNKKQFKAWQALAIVETTISGLTGSIEAFKALAGIPYVGPALGAVAAASVLAQTAVTIAKIKKEKYRGGGGGSSSVGGGFNINTGSTGGGAPPEPQQGPQKLEITNIVNLDGEKVYENVKEHNAAAVRAGRGGAFAKAS